MNGVQVEMDLKIKPQDTIITGLLPICRTPVSNNERKRCALQQPYSLP